MQQAIAKDTVNKRRIQGILDGLKDVDAGNTTPHETVLAKWGAKGALNHAPDRFIHAIDCAGSDEPC